MSFEETLFDAPQKEKKDLLKILGMEGRKWDLASLKKDAENGNKNAMFLLANNYEKGDGVPKDIAEACYWYEQCDDAMAFVNLADIYRNEGNQSLASEYLLQAVSAPEDRSGSHRAIACITLANQNIKDNPAKADTWMEKALAMNPSDEVKQIIYNMADILGKQLDNKGENKVRAIYWYKLFLNHSKEDEIVRKRLYLDYVSALDGKMGEELQKEALDVLEAEAENGNRVLKDDIDDVLLTGRLFVCYLQGRKKAENLEKYLYWTEKAAEMGTELAQYRMAIEYLGAEYSGLAEKDIEKSKKYFKICEKWIREGKDGEKLHQYFLSIYDKEEKAKFFEKYPEKHLTSEIAAGLLKEMKASGSHVLRIPDGYTHIDGGFKYYAHKEVTAIEEIIFPDSVMYIDTVFEGVINLTKITLPPNLKQLSGVFERQYLGLFNRWVRGKKPIERLVIPAKCELSAEALVNALDIKELIFEDGRMEINWDILHENRIGYAYVPDSVVRFSGGDYYGVLRFRFKIEELSIPAHLKEEYQRTLGSEKSAKKVIYR